MFCERFCQVSGIPLRANDELVFVLNILLAALNKRLQTLPYCEGS